MNRLHQYRKYFIRTCVPMLILVVFLQGMNYTPPSIDHAKVIGSLNKTTLKKGEEIYKKACASCHGNNGTASLPQARSFNKDVLRFGNKPYDMWKTITNGSGMMAAQTWLSPEERYYVIQYIRETFLKTSKAKQYFPVNDKYLASLPKSKVSIMTAQALIKTEAKKGSLQYGQQWFSKTNSDYGKALYSQLKEHSTSSLTVSGDKQLFLSYDLHRMKLSAVWKGKFNTSDTKYKLYRGEGQPFIDGVALQGLETWQWTVNGLYDSLNAVTGIRKPFDRSWMHYKGHYVVGNNTVLSYSVRDRNILEQPASFNTANGVVLSQTLTVGPGTVQSLIIGQDSDTTEIVTAGSWLQGKFPGHNAGSANASAMGIKAGAKGSAKSLVYVAVVGDNSLLQAEFNSNGQLVLTIPAADQEISFTVIRSSGKSVPGKTFEQLVDNMQTVAPVSLSDLVKAIPVEKTERIVLRGSINAGRPHFDPRHASSKDKTAVDKLVTIPADYPYTVDNIPLPFNNAFNAWIRPTALAFMNDGRLLITTYTGDVWCATGIDSTLANVQWQRMASGLYEPMGIKVINGEILVTCRNGIMKLHDLNGDNVTDYYQQYYPDQDVSNFFHAFNFGLETDSKGNLYYVKPGEYTDNKDPGNVIKVSADGLQAESIATGFRVNNGITISPDDLIFVSDNQGNWTPANKINVIEKGKYYGYVPNLVSNGWSPNGKQYSPGQVTDGVISKSLVPVPDTFAQPALWIPQEFDNSPGGGTWSDASWGPLGNKFIHTSYGTGWTYYVLPKKVEDNWQASMIALPFQFDAGIQRAAVNPVDKDVYVTGLTGWDDGVAKTYGTLARVRYKGGAGHMIEDINVLKGAISIRFNCTLNAAALQPGDFDVSMWNYKWTSNYGSAHYSVLQPGKEGADTLPVTAIALEPGETTIHISIPSLQKANTVRLRMKITAADGVVVNETVYLTINKIAGE